MLTSQQELLLEHRKLLSPGGASQVLGIKRPTVYDWLDGGKLLMWVFVRRGRHPKLWEHYIDFGPRAHDLDVTTTPEGAASWKSEGGPEGILAALQGRLGAA